MRSDGITLFTTCHDCGRSSCAFSKFILVRKKHNSRHSVCLLGWSLISFFCEFGLKLFGHHSESVAIYLVKSLSMSLLKAAETLLSIIPFLTLTISFRSIIEEDWKFVWGDKKIRIFPLSSGRLCSLLSDFSCDIPPRAWSKLISLLHVFWEFCGLNVMI